MGPGADLAEQFGHSAFRIKDPVNGIDLIYNYGVFDYNAPNFYTNFAKGKLLYALGVNRFERFKNSYKSQGRWMKEQVLDLDKDETLAVASYLQNNAKPENKGYLYDFFFDNCATKMRDVLQLSLGDKLTYHNTYVTEHRTFRKLIRSRLNTNTWGSLGIDIALGSVIDRTATTTEHQFLPDYVYDAAKVATIAHNGKSAPLVLKDKEILKETKAAIGSAFFTSPLFFFGILALLILYATFKDYKSQSRSRFLDFALLLITGLTGIFLLLLWVATDHTATANNYNLLWAFPLNAILAFVALKKTPPSWFSRYLFLLLVFFTLLVLHWITGVQVFAPAFIPLFIALVIRYVYVWRFLK